MQQNFETIDFTRLVNESVNLSTQFKSQLVEVLEKSFTNEEQQLFIANFYMYLKFDSITDFPIDLENVFGFIGFANKGNAKRTLENNFIIEEDYKIIIDSDGVEKVILPTEKNPNYGGRPTEQILMNIDTFKTLCMLAKTDKGKFVKKYYIKLESIYNKLINAERLQYEENIKQNEKKIQELEIKSLTDRKMEKHKVLLETLKSKRCVYLIEIAANKVKIGSSKIIEDRCGNIKNKFGGEGIFLDVFECDLAFRDIERMILDRPDIKKHKFREPLETGHVSTETILLSDEFNYDQLVTIVKHCIQQNDYMTPQEVLRKQYMEFESKKLDVESKKLDIISKLVDSGNLSELDTIMEKINSQFSENETITTILEDHESNIESKRLNIISKAIDLKYNLADINKLINNASSSQDPLVLSQKIKNFGRKIQRIDPNNLNTIIQVYKDMESAIHSTHNSAFSETGIRDAIRENRVYKNFRWLFVENDQDPNVVHNIQQTVTTKRMSSSIIFELNDAKSTIMNHYLTLNIASATLKIPLATLRKIIIDNTKHMDHYYVYQEDCSQELLESYDKPLDKPLPKCSVAIKAINPETNEEIIFPSLRHAHDFCKIHHKTVRRAIEEKKLSHGFYWKLVE